VRLRDPAALFGLAQAAIWEAFVHQRLGDHEAAARSLSEARLLVEDPQFPAEWRDREQHLLDMNGSLMLASVGRFDEAISAARRAVAYFAGGKEQHNYAKSVANLGRVLAVADAPHAQEAVQELIHAAELEAAGGLKSWEPDTCEVLGDLLIRLGRVEEGRRWLARAAELAAGLDGGEPDQE
jgi:tetratricopeptide (TPR) repeat protein